MKLIPIDLGDIDIRLDVFMAERGNLTRSASQKLIKAGRVTVNGTVASKNYKTKAGDVIEFIIPEAVAGENLPQDIALDILYEDEHLLVVNKPKGMVVHPAAGNPDNTLVNALLYHCGDSLSGINGVIRPGIVHRIDKDTSGLLVVAKNDKAHVSLAEQIKSHSFDRFYEAVCCGHFREQSGTVDAPIGRHPIDRKRMAVIRNADLKSREAITHWQVLARAHAEGQAFTLLRCELETGRTHQIRVHLASIGHPLLGDPVYGGANTQFEAKHQKLVNGQALHAKELEFTHPKTNSTVHFSSPLPENMQKLVTLLFEKE